MLDSRNPMVVVLVALLFFESITCGLAIAVMLQITQVDPVLAAVSGGGVALVALIAAMMLRRGAVGWVLGWATQLAAIALGFLTPAMFGMGAVFAFLWLVTFVLGRRLANRAAETR